MPRLIKLVNGIPTAFDATLSGTQVCEEFVLDSTDISNKYVDLTQDPADANCVQVFVVSGGFQNRADHWNIINDGGSNPRRLTWDSAEATVSSGMEADLIVGDKIRVYYF